MVSEKVVFLIVLFASATRANNPCENRHHELINDYASCDRYFFCSFYFPHPLRCQNNMWFYKGECHLPHSVPCTACPPDGVFSFAVINSCTKYRLCVYGIYLEMECAPGTKYDWTQQRCAPEEHVFCAYMACAADADGIQIIGDPLSCSHYLICENGTEVARRECAPGLLFDPTLGTCSRTQYCHLLST